MTTTGGNVECAKWGFHMPWEMWVFQESGDNLLLSVLRADLRQVYNLSELENRTILNSTRPSWLESTVVAQSQT